jgi:hypothetical protein
MAKETGLGWTTFSVDDAAGTPRDIRNPTTSLSFATPREVQDVTGLDKSAMERLLLLADFSVDPSGVFDDGTNLSHSVFKTVPSSSVVRTVTITVSGQTLAGELLFTDYSLERGDDGAFTWTAPGVLADGTVPTWS